MVSDGSREAGLGAGKVGGALLRRLENEPALTVRSVLVRDGSRARQLAPQQQQVLTSDPTEALAGAELLVELRGGTGLADELKLEALGRGIPVVTGKKAAPGAGWERCV